MKPQKIYLKVPGRAHSHLLLRFILRAVILAVAVFGLGSFYVLFFIDLNQHKEHIELLVKQYSGLEIKLNGKLKHSTFNGLKVSAIDVSLRSKGQPWLEIDSLKVAIDILPLIHKSLNISSLELGIKKLHMSQADLAKLNLFDVAKADNSVAKNKQAPSPTSLVAQYIPQLEQLQLQNIHLRIDDFSFIDKKKALALQLQALDFQLSELALMQQGEFVFAQPQRFLANKFSGQFKVDAIHFKNQDVSKHLLDLKGSFSNQQGTLHLDDLNFRFQQLSGENKSRLEFTLAGKTSLNLPTQSTTTSAVLGWRDIKNLAVLDLDFDFNPFHIDLATGAMDLSNTRLVIKKWRLKSEAQSLFELFSLPLEQLMLNSQLSAQVYSSQVKLPHTRINNIALNLNNNRGKIQFKLDDFSARQHFTWAANKKAELDLNINALLEAQIESSADDTNPSALFTGNIKILRAQVSSNEILLNIADEDIYRLQSSLMEISNLRLLEGGNAPSPSVRDWASALSQGSLEIKSSGLTKNGEGAENIQIKLIGNEDKLQVSKLVFDLAQSYYTLQAALDVSAQALSWQLHGEVASLKLDPLLKRLNEEDSLSGEGKLSINLYGSDFKREIDNPKDINGQLDFSAKDIQVQKIDLDALLKHFEDSQGVGLIDVGAYAVAGPAGVLLVKGNDYHNLRTAAMNSQGTSSIQQLNISVLLEDGLVKLEDVALSTSQHLLAAQGALDLVQDEYQGVELATIDSSGCVIYKEQVRGPIDKPQIIAVNRVVKTLVNPIKSIISSTKDVLTMTCQEPFYQGQVKYLREANGLQKKLIEPVDKLTDLLRSASDISILGQETTAETEVSAKNGLAVKELPVKVIPVKELPAKGPAGDLKN